MCKYGSITLIVGKLF